VNIRVDHSGPEPVVVVDRGYGEERLTMDELRAAAAGMPDVVRERVEESAAGEEFAHTLIMGLGLEVDQ
jgi:hypothetical protein